MLTVAANQGPSISGPTFLIVLLASGFIYGFGYLMAIMRRANSDYKATKSAVKVLRKAFWTTFFNAMKAGFWVLLVILVLLVWVVHDVRAKNTPTPAPSVSVRPSKRP